MNLGQMKGAEEVAIVRYDFKCGNDRSTSFSAPEAQSDEEFAKVLEGAAASLRASFSHQNLDFNDSDKTNVMINDNDFGDYLKCDICKSDYHENVIYHYSGILDKKINKHIHVCCDCVNGLVLFNNIDFDVLIAQADLKTAEHELLMEQLKK